MIIYVSLCNGCNQELRTTHPTQRYHTMACRVLREQRIRTMKTDACRGCKYCQKQSKQAKL